LHPLRLIVRAPVVRRALIAVGPACFPFVRLGRLVRAAVVVRRGWAVAAVALRRRVLRPVRWRLRTANRRVPTADDSHCSCPPVGVGEFRGTIGGSETRRRAAIIGCISLRFPNAVGYCPCAAAQCCPSWRWTSAGELGVAEGRPALRQLPLPRRQPPMCSAYSMAGPFIAGRIVSRSIRCSRALIHRAHFAGRFCRAVHRPAYRV